MRKAMTRREFTRAGAAALLSVPVVRKGKSYRACVIGE